MASSIESTSPSLSDAEDSPMEAASALTVTRSVSWEFSKATIAVIILVTEAICVCLSGSRSKYTVPLPSTT